MAILDALEMTTTPANDSIAFGLAVVLAGAFALGCSGGDDSRPTPPEVDLDPPERGFQIQSIGTVIEPGADVEYCEIAELPGSPDETYYVVGFDTWMTGYSHHLIVFVAEPGSPGDERYQVGDLFECEGHDMAAAMGHATNAQRPERSVRFPDGVGRRYRGGQKIAFNYHHLNTSKEPAHARHAINFRLSDADGVRKIAQDFAMANLAFEVPPQTEESFVMEAAFDQNVVVWTLGRHTHRWGTDFHVEFAGGPKDGEHIWTSEDFELDTEFVFDEPELVESGNGFRFQCDFKNTTNEPLGFGLKATDEMCILFGTWWVENVGDEVEGQLFIGQGVDADGITRGEKTSLRF